MGFFRNTLVNYTDRQRQMDATHAAEYRAWVESLPVAERRHLEKQGLADADTSRRISTRSTGDVLLSLPAHEEAPSHTPDPWERPSVLNAEDAASGLVVGLLNIALSAR